MKCDNLCVWLVYSSLHYGHQQTTRDQWVALLCFQFDTIAKGLHISLPPSPSDTATAALLTHPWAAFFFFFCFFCLRGFRDWRGPRLSVEHTRAGKSSWCWTFEKQLGLDSWPFLHSTVRPTEAPSPLTGQGQRGPPFYPLPCSPS